MITIKFGMDNELRKTVSEFATTGSIMRNAGLRSDLGFGDNVESHVNGVAVNSSYALRDGDIVTSIPRANSKG